jgi:hypothetical protein
MGHVIEPLLYGHSTGLSPVAVVASATFWTALWGPVGLVLATPLTVCLVVLGRHVERLEFLDVMFGDRPALSPPEIFYQRMLAGDPAEAVDKAEEFLKEQSLSTYYDEVALRGLKLAQNDVVRGTLDRPQTEKIKAAVIEVVDDLADHEHGKPERGMTHDLEAEAAIETTDDARPELAVLKKEDLGPEWQADTPVLCAAGRGPLDEAAAMMLAQLLEKHGLGARVEGAEAIASSNILRLETSGLVIVCLSYFDVSSPAHMRYAIRRIRRRLPRARILLGCWRTDADATKLRDTAKSDAVTTSLRDAVKFCLDEANKSQGPLPPADVQSSAASADAA